MAGGSAVTSRSAILIVPALAVSSPAISRKVVDLPQPEGPSSATRWPAGAEKLTFSTAAAVPQALVIPSRWTSAIPQTLGTPAPTGTA